MVVVGTVVPRVLDRLGRSSQLEPTKRGLVDALVAYLGHEVDPGARLTLHVDFRSARHQGGFATNNPSFDWSGLALPDSEPTPHDWLRLRAPLRGRGALVLSLRARTLLGTSGEELRLRDEIGIELRGEGIATQLAAAIPASLRTTLLAHDLTPNQARLQFRGGCAARRQLASDEDEPRDLWSAANAMTKYQRNSFLPEPPEYCYFDVEWLLTGNALVEHIELARALVRPSEAA
jgi:hypothetical protein